MGVKFGAPHEKMLSVQKDNRDVLTLNFQVSADFLKSLYPTLDSKLKILFLDRIY